MRRHVYEQSRYAGAVLVSLDGLGEGWFGEGKNLIKKKKLGRVI
jgi:hypothetical protein